MGQQCFIMMKIQAFIDDNEHSITYASQLEDVEYVSPVVFFVETQLEAKKTLIQDMAVRVHPELKNLSDDYWYLQATKIIEGILSDFAKTRLPDNFLSLLDGGKRKKEQISLMRGQTLTPKQLFALLIDAENKGYTFSEYHYQATPPNVDKEQLPEMIEIKEGGSVRFVGETELSDGQMKAVIEQTKKIVAKVVDRGDEWHCFYLTFRGLAGKESGEQGQRPHLHYISDKFGISREDLVKSIKKGECPASSVHIGILDYLSSESKKS